MSSFIRKRNMRRMLEEFRRGAAGEGLGEQCEAFAPDVEALCEGLLVCLEDELYAQEFMEYGSMYRRAVEMAVRQRESGVPIEKAVRLHITMRDSFSRIAKSRAEKKHDLQDEKRVVRCFNDLLQATLRAYEERRDDEKADPLRDPATGVFSRAYFMARLEEEVRRSERYLHDVTVMLVDVRSTEPMEPEGGAELMRAVARVLRRNSRASDVLARVEHGRFAMLVPETGSKDTAVAAGRMKEQVSAYLAEMGEPYDGVGVETGIASYPEHAREGEALFNEAMENLREETGGT